MKFVLLAVAFFGAVVLTGCENMTPEQIAATSAGITAVATASGQLITATGQVVTPIVLEKANAPDTGSQYTTVKVKAKKVKAKNLKKATPSPAPELPHF